MKVALHSFPEGNEINWKQQNKEFEKRRNVNDEEYISMIQSKL